MRMTKHRKEVYELFQKHPDELFSAEKIMDELKDSKMDLSTIYRALDLFNEKDMIFKTVVDQTSYYYLEEHSHSHFMICVLCNKKIKIPCHVKMENYSEYAKDFLPVRHDLTIYGYCGDCRK